MTDTLSDLFRHQEWADSIHWRAFAAHPDALNDDALRRRLYHIQAVQRAFLSVWKGTPVWPEPFESYSSMHALRESAMRYHREIAQFLRDVGPDRLEANVTVPWFPAPKRPIRLLDTMHQVLLHSHGHRAQNGTRFRELGGDPPTIDYIVWVLSGKPEPAWD